MARRKREPRLGLRLIAAMKESLAHIQAGGTLRTWVVQRPDPAPVLRPKQVAALRRNMRFSQDEFAAVLNVSIKTVQAWEQGLRKPDGAALRLLEVAARKPKALLEIAPCRRELVPRRPARRRRRELQAA